VAKTTSTNPIRGMWDRLHHLPAGKFLFNLLLGRTAPYTGTIRPRVLDLRAGYARVSMNDRRAVRNHLRSIHAVALANLAEVTSGLALHYALPDHARAILTRLDVEFVKKGRGRLTADASAPIPEGVESEEIELLTTVRDAAGDEVARAHAHWLVGPRPA
jgi:acyl-coenzyme A thioesterase PaaI-like protein